MKSGFLFEDKRIYFIDERGKDPRNDIHRWRVNLYYQPGFALNHFFYSEQEYSAFIKEKLPYCHADYDKYKLEAGDRELRRVHPDKP